MFGAPGSAGPAGGDAGAGTGAAAGGPAAACRAGWRGATACPTPAVVRARIGARGSDQTGTPAGAATRGFDTRFGAAGRSSGIVTLISGSGIAPGVVGAALGAAGGAAPAPLGVREGSAAGDGLGGAASAGLAGSAASAGFSSAGWPRPWVTNAADSSSPAASDDVKRNIRLTESEWRDG